jgi:hypothetical protein
MFSDAAIELTGIIAEDSSTLYRSKWLLIRLDERGEAGRGSSHAVLLR